MIQRTHESNTASPRIGRAPPDAMADVPGMCDLPLTRAVIVYRPANIIEEPRGAIDDIGLGVVLVGDTPIYTAVVDLGSGAVRHVDLTTEIVVLDWVHQATLEHIRRLLGRNEGLLAESGEARHPPLVQFCQKLALVILGRVGYNGFTRPTVLRIGFRDIVRDVDPNETTAARLSIGPRNTAEIHMDVENVALTVREHHSVGESSLLGAFLHEAFPTASHRAHQDGEEGRQEVEVRLALPTSVWEARELMSEVRAGLLRLYAHYEPERHAAVRRRLDVFGPRETLLVLGDQILRSGES